MESCRLLWAKLGPDRAIENSERGKTEDPTLDETIACLDRILGGAGLVELVIVQPSETGPRGLQLRTDEGRSIITLAEVDEKLEKNIRTYRAGPDGEDVDMLGGQWKSQMVCRDDELVKEVFRELMSTGNVSTDLLS